MSKGGVSGFLTTEESLHCIVLLLKENSSGSKHIHVSEFAKKKTTIISVALLSNDVVALLSKDIVIFLSKDIVILLSNNF